MLETIQNIQPKYYFQRGMSRELWQEIIELKENFIRRNEDPRKSNLIRKEIAESWVRSRQLGVYPESALIVDYLSEDEFARIREKDLLLIEIASPLIDNFMELATSTGYALQLFNREGIHIAGTRINTVEVPENCIVRNVSTTAHSLAIIHKKPFQLVGPENYLNVLQNVISSAAPILDEKGEVLGALALIQDMGEDPWSINSNSLFAHSLGWVSSLAIAIAGQITLRKSYEKLSKANETLEATFELFDEGVVAIEPNGTIVCTNRVGRSILNLDNGSKKQRNIKEFLTGRSTLLENLTTKNKIDYLEENIRVRQEETPYLISIRPVNKQNTRTPDVAVLRFHRPDKINSLITKRSGASAKYTFSDIIGKSEVIKRTKNLAKRFAATEENILLLGESGTGKEVFVQAIHNYSRPNSPFIALNCAAMPRNLIESELFGYESGTFTGADKSGRPGKIELANGGTLFLDEIGDMPYELQSVILRVLQDKQVLRLGGRRYKKVDFRLIAATNQDLRKLIAEKLFREDLYFRLSVLSIEIPPLRERRSDIMHLANYFLESYAERMGCAVPRISLAAQEIIENYDWPGNVRQLENVMIYAFNMAEDNIIDIQHLPKGIRQRENFAYALREEDVNVTKKKATKGLSAMKNVEKSIIENALIESDFRVAKAAKLLGVSKTTVYRKAKKYNIDLKQEDI